MNRITRFFIFMGLVGLISGLFLAGCSSNMAFESASAPPSADESGSFEADAVAEAEPRAIDGADYYADGDSVSVEDFLSVAVAQAQTRVIVYTGNMSLVVSDTEEAISDITTLAEEQGGFIAGSNVYEASGALRGNLIIRVPAERYQDTITQLRDLALRVERENSATEDVTAEFTDLQARKANLEFTEEALQKLLDERQRVGSTADILEVYRELTTIRGQIEQIEGRLRYLANQSALSTIEVTLTPDVLSQPISVAGWQPQGVAREALQSLVVALQGLVNVGIWLAIFVLPLVVIILIPVALVFLAVRRWWTRRQQRKPVEPAPAK